LDPALESWTARRRPGRRGPAGRFRSRPPKGRQRWRTYGCLDRDATDERLAAEPELRKRFDEARRKRLGLNGDKIRLLPTSK
jgi:hypothetical protein